MFPMNHVQTWSMILALLAVIAAVIWVLYEVVRHFVVRARRAHDDDRTSQAPEALATGAPRLYALPAASPPPLYDWRRQGL